jgi:type II secretory pathway pseudopilin PulG
MDPITRASTRIVRDDEGLGLMEIVVAMFILALLALSLLPLLINGMQSSVRNTTIAAATQFANDRMSIAETVAAQSDDPCDDLAIFAADVEPMTDARGVELVATSTIGPCPPGTGTISVATAVTRADTPGEVLASASTNLLIVVRP